MLMIRLQRVGRKHDPTFRVVVTEKARGVRSGRHVEVLGFYDARSGKRSINPERVRYWLGEGAKLSATIHNFLVDAKLLDAKKINVLPAASPSSAPSPAGDEEDGISVTPGSIAAEAPKKEKNPEDALDTAV